MDHLDLLAGLKALEKNAPTCEVDHDESRSEGFNRWSINEIRPLLQMGSLVLISRRRLRQIIEILEEAFIDMRTMDDSEPIREEIRNNQVEKVAHIEQSEVVRRNCVPVVENPVPANSYMVGGNHYRETEGEQHWDRIWRLYGRGYFVGCITKYVERFHLKEGLKDLQKARHFLDKLIELETAKLETNNEGSLDNAKR